MKPSWLLASLCLVGMPWAEPLAAQQVKSTAIGPFPNFESGPSRALLLSPTGNTLYAVNTPDGRVEIYTAPGLKFQDSIFTGLDPVSMELGPNDNYLYVANYVSDSVAVVELATNTVVATIPVGDEPADLVRVGSEIWVACARARDITNPATWIHNVVVVIDTNSWTVTQQVPVLGHKPRALATNGSTVFVIPLNSGNNTTIIDDLEAVTNGLLQTTLDSHDANFNFDFNEVLLKTELATQWGIVPPLTIGLGWLTAPTGRIVNDLEYPEAPDSPDNDIIEISTASYAVTNNIKLVGTTLFDVEINPSNGELWVANQDANNRTRMEHNLTGAAFTNQVSGAAPGSAQASRFIDLSMPTTANEHGQPVSLAFHSGRNECYVAALGTSTLVVLNANNGSVIQEVALPSLPMGLAVDEGRNLLYVFSRGEMSITKYRLGFPMATGGTVPLSYDPEPKGIRVGREHLYSAKSDGHGNGNLSCASCHIFSHFDNMAWDLGDEGGGLSYVYPDLYNPDFFGEIVAHQNTPGFNPMKGPMVTQSLRGLDTDEPFHWRGDRRFFQDFKKAFVGLLGGTGVSTQEMQEYTTFVRSVIYPPNPLEPLDRVYTGSEAAGLDFYGLNPNVSGKAYSGSGNFCITCHEADFVNKTNFKGDRLNVGPDAQLQMFNTPQLRGLYEKDFKELTGFGASHDGHEDGIRGFMDITLFLPTPGEGFPLMSPTERDQMADFINAWDTGTPPLVGQQYHLSSDPNSLAGVTAWLDLAESQVINGDIDLAVKGFLNLNGGGKRRHGLYFWFDGSGWNYAADTGGWVSRGVLVSLASQGKLELTFTCVPRQTGYRLGVDHDLDFIRDFVERSIRTDAHNPDTDDDGYTDFIETQNGTDPTMPDAFVPDTVAPTLFTEEVHSVYVDSATVSFVTLEPSNAQIDVGTAPGLSDVGSFADSDLQLTHDVILDNLPANTTLFYSLTTADKNNNTTTSSGQFTTKPPLWSVQDISLSKSGSGPYDLTATVTVVDHTGATIAGIDVRLLWDSTLDDIPNWDMTAPTDNQGVATFQLLGYNPATNATVTVSPAYVGSINPADPFFVGRGGDTQIPGFYTQNLNLENFDRISVP